MNRKVFRIVQIVEKPTKSKGNNNLRLVCLTDDGEKVVFWGREYANQRNIDAVCNAEFPMVVSCECIPPSDFGKRYGHDWWVPEDSDLHTGKSPI